MYFHFFYALYRIQKRGNKRFKGMVLWFDEYKQRTTWKKFKNKFRFSQRLCKIRSALHALCVFRIQICMLLSILKRILNTAFQKRTVVSGQANFKEKKVKFSLPNIHFLWFLITSNKFLHFLPKVNWWPFAPVSKDSRCFQEIAQSNGMPHAIVTNFIRNPQNE